MTELLLQKLLHCWRLLKIKVMRWWIRDGEAVKGRKMAPGEDPLLAVRIPPGRSYIALGLITGFLAILVVRAFWLQGGISTAFLQHQGEVRFARTLKVPALRGQILDRNGIVLASTMPARCIWVVPSEFEQADATQVKKLARLLEMRPKDIRKKVELRR